MKKSQKTIVATTMAMILLVTGLIYGFYMLSMKKGEEKSKKPESEAETLLIKEIEANYPETPGEVVKLYLRITKCLYNDKISQQEMEDLTEQLRILFDKELLEKNPKESHVAGIQSERDKFQEDGVMLLDYGVSDSRETKYGEMDAKDYAAVRANIFMKDKNRNRTKTKEDFLLRKDEKGKWRIVQWQLSGA